MLSDWTIACFLLLFCTLLLKSSGLVTSYIYQCKDHQQLRTCRSSVDD